MDTDFVKVFVRLQDCLFSELVIFCFFTLSGCRINLNHHVPYVGQVYNPLSDHILYVQSTDTLNEFFETCCAISIFFSPQNAM